MKIDGFKMDQDSRRAETQFIYIYIKLIWYQSEFQVLMG